MPRRDDIRKVLIIAAERSDALLPNLGGQTGLSLSAELHRTGVLDRYGVKVIGLNVDAIQCGEGRIAFKETHEPAGHRHAGQPGRHQR